MAKDCQTDGVPFGRNLSPTLYNRSSAYLPSPLSRSPMHNCD